MRIIRPDRARIKLIPAVGLLAIFAFFSLRIAGAADFRFISGPCNFSFPRDHAAHPDCRTEWWYYTGNLRAEDGARYGFQLTFFRMGTVPAFKGKPPSEKQSAWRSDQVFAVHAAISDITSDRFLRFDRMSRAALELAGAREAEGTFKIFVNGCSAAITPANHLLRAKSADFALSLKLIPLKDPAAHGDSGWSIKGECPGEGSCYYSIPRLEVSGNVSVGGREKSVRGTAWMDHEFSTTPLNPRFAGWDWFGLQFSDGSELMVYLMREKNGEHGPISSGTFVDRQGKQVRLFAGDIRLHTLEKWKSPHSGALYPSSWLLEIVPLDLSIRIAPNLADQEMQSPGSTRITYWEGSIRAEGSAGGRTIDGNGYAELAGYAGPVRF
jgi:predicted secreted hydrolase